MLRNLISFMLLCLLSLPARAERVDRHFLGDVVSDSVSGIIYDNLDKWRDDRRHSFLDLASRLPDSIKQKVIRRAEGYLSYGWPALPATLYIQYKETGNRTNFQNAQIERRGVLSTLVLAEVFEGKGRFMDQVINGVWATCEESSWCLPAHQSSAAKKQGLPVPGENIVDLIVGEDAATMSWILLLLGDRLDERTPAVTRRIRHELRERILIPNYEKEFNRMSLGGGPTNNWTVWIGRNWLWAMSMANCMSRDEFVISMRRLVRSIDNYISWYPADGGCDEGINYWTLSPPFYLDILEFFDFMLPGKFDHLKKNEILRNMVSYVGKMEIDKGYYVNFADSSPFVSPNISAIYLWGKFLDDKNIMGYAAFNSTPEGISRQFASGALHRYFNLMRTGEGLSSVPPVRYMPSFSPFPDLQVVTARDKKGSAAGFFVAAKGGHNAESHNHNDIGNFIVSFDGVPVLVDVGVSTYTAKTFGPARYSIWAMQSGWHNTPTINGFEQKNGRQYEARDVRMEDKGAKMIFSADISKAYPADAKVDKWMRTVELVRGKRVVVEDEYSLSAYLAPAQYNLITPLNVDTSTPGKIILEGEVRGRKAKAEIEYDKSRFRAEVDTMDLDDPKMKGNWGSKMYRVILVATNSDLKGKDRITINCIKP